MFGADQVKSSLLQGYELKEQLGNKKWEDVTPGGACAFTDLLYERIIWPHKHAPELEFHIKGTWKLCYTRLRHVFWL